MEPIYRCGARQDYFVFSLVDVEWMVGLVCLGLGWIVGLKVQGKKG